MKLTVLGNNGPFPCAGGACSGYLITEGQTNVLIDCGNGVLSNLQKVIPISDISLIILTHLHSDHISDMMVLRYAVKIKNKREGTNKIIDVYAPPQPEEEYKRLNIKDAFKLNPISEESVIKQGPFKFTFKQMTHPVMDLAVCVNNGSKKFVFSGDTSFNEKIIDFSKNSDLLMLDAGFLNKDKTQPNVPHLTAGECGKIAKEACAKRLLLTHFWPENDVSVIKEEAKEYYPAVECAKILKTYKI